MKRGLGGHTFHIGLVGGCLQGLEAAYLACEAGYHLTVIDRAPEAPAMTMAHNTHVFDVQEEPRRFREVLLGMDAILPTTEEQGTLDFLARTCQESGVVFLHDLRPMPYHLPRREVTPFLPSTIYPSPKNGLNVLFQW